MKNLLNLLTITCVLLTPGISNASREPTPEEQTGISQAVTAPTYCVKTNISTTDSTWATAISTYNTGCSMIDGVTVLHYDLALQTWKVLIKWSELELTPCPVENIPTATAYDLLLCRKVKPSSRTYVVNFANRKKSFKPNWLPQGAHGFFNKLRWSRWNSKKAFGRGTFYYTESHLKFRIPILIQLYKVKTCSDGTRIFTKRRIAAIKRTDHRKIKFEARHTNYGRCSLLSK